MSWKAYSEYKDSGLDSLGEVPKHWEVRKLKHIASITSSNVDKNSVEGEHPIRLCNYIDVYNNDFILPEINFMEATASRPEIDKFNLLKGDVLVTKDSEDWRDIAVSAYVAYDMDDVICGYHLARVRSDTNFVKGKYLFRAFSACGLNEQFRIAATGITRYGLGKYWLDNSLFPVPPIDEQHAITAFLDRETERIDTLIAKKKRQIELLREKRAALISRLVTKGLNPNVKMKDSGIERIGLVPDGWKLAKLKRLVSIIDGDRGTEYPNENDLVDEGIPFLSSKNIVNNRIDYADLRFISLDKFNRLGRGKLRSGDLVVTVRGTIGSAGLFRGERFETGFINAQMMILRPVKEITSLFLHHVASSGYWLTQLDVSSYGTAQQQLSNEILSNLQIIVPTLLEQEYISTYLDRETGRIDALIARVQSSIERLREYRMALISAAVIGKIDVRKEGMK